MNLTCFSTSDAAARNASRLFDYNDDFGNLWMRGNPKNPLPFCSSSSPPSDSHCLVCLDEIVFAVCRNLKKSVNVIMEAGATVDISKNNCPGLLSDIGHADGSLGTTGICVIVFCLLFLITIAIVIGYAVFQRRNRSALRDEAKPNDLMLNDV